MDASDPASARATMVFSIPPLPADDFRYRADCGGGSLNDLGPYVVAADRVLFGAPPVGVCCAVLSTAGSPQVDTSFSVLLTHENGRALIGHCGFVTHYQNRLSVLTRSCAIEVERIFSTPPDFVCTLTVTEPGRERAVTVPAADAFARFLQAFCEAIDRHELDCFEAALLADARLLARLREATGAR
jgi:NDP-hexose-3-ketoreductase